MRTGNVFGALTALLVASALGQSTEYSAAEAAAHIGETATVAGKVVRANQSVGGNIFLNMGGAPPNETFTIFIPADAASTFADFKKYEGATVTVTGRIIAHGDKPQIVVNSPHEITVKEGAPATDGTPTPSPAGS